MLGIAGLLFLNAYILLNHDEYIHEEGDRDKLVASKNSTIYFILVVLLALSLSFIIPAYASLTYLLIIPFELQDHILKK